MKGLCLICAVLCLFCARPAAAQDSPFLPAPTQTPVPLGEVLPEAQCFAVINRAPYKVFGSIHTNYFIRADGIRTRHKSNFRLEAEGTAEFCTSGPFYDGRKIELVLRTLIPIFRCKTAIYDDIVIYGRRKPEGGTETYAACLE